MHARGECSAWRSLVATRPPWLRTSCVIACLRAGGHLNSQVMFSPPPTQTSFVLGSCACASGESSDAAIGVTASDLQASCSVCRTVAYSGDSFSRKNVSYE